MTMRSMFPSVFRTVAASTVLVAAAAGFANAPRIVVTFRGRALKFTKIDQPYRSQRTVMVPFRQTGAMVGATVSRNSDGKHLTIAFGKDSIVYEPGHHGYRLNGRHQTMRAASEMRRGRLFVPIRLYNDVTAGLVHAEIR